MPKSNAVAAGRKRVSYIEDIETVRKIEKIAKETGMTVSDVTRIATKSFAAQLSKPGEIVLQRVPAK